MKSELTLEEIYAIAGARELANMVISDYARGLPAILETALKQRFMPSGRIFEYLDQTLSQDDVTFIRSCFPALDCDITYHPPNFFRTQGYIKIAYKPTSEQDD